MPRLETENFPWPHAGVSVFHWLASPHISTASCCLALLKVRIASASPRPPKKCLDYITVDTIPV